MWGSLKDTYIELTHTHDEFTENIRCAAVSAISRTGFCAVFDNLFSRCRAYLGVERRHFDHLL